MGPQKRSCGNGCPGLHNSSTFKTLPNSPKNNWDSCVGYAINIDSLHRGDFVFKGNRRLLVLRINREDRRLLVRGRKACDNSLLFWGDLNEFQTMPSRLQGETIESINDLDAATGEAIKWEPNRKPAPTKDTSPGSAERIEVYRLRVERGEEIFHQDDATHSGELGGTRYESEEWAVEFFLEAEQLQDAAKQCARMNF
jgi:hypothetical protein